MIVFVSRVKIVSSLGFSEVLVFLKYLSSLFFNEIFMGVSNWLRNVVHKFSEPNPVNSIFKIYFPNRMSNYQVSSQDSPVFKGFNQSNLFRKFWALPFWKALKIVYNFYVLSFSIWACLSAVNLLTKSASHWLDSIVSCHLVNLGSNFIWLCGIWVIVLVHMFCVFNFVKLSRWWLCLEWRNFLSRLSS